VHTLLVGDRDDFASKEAVGTFARKCNDPWSVEVYPGADHFAFVPSPW
jgi:hypothetical protein